MSDLGIVICQWQRIQWFPRILDDLRNQQDSAFQLFIWNNNHSAASELEHTIAQHAQGLRVRCHHHPENVGGVGRFILAKSLHEEADFRFGVFLDDDVHIAPDVVSTFRAEASANTIASFWAWLVRGGYWKRRRPAPGKECNYCGTGGMVLDLSIFSIPLFWKMFPQRYRFVEDLYLSHFARSIGWRLIRSRAKITLEPSLDGTPESLSPKVRHLKSEFVADYFGASPPTRVDLD